MLKTMISFIAGTILGALLSGPFGLWGGIFGGLAGAIFAWWAVRRLNLPGVR